MKKSLLAVAAMTAFAGVAQAQSSVTVYGILDVGYIGSNQILAANANSAATGQAINKTTAGGIGSGAESTSRLGFRGTEDLGGGSSAFFTVEVAIGVNDSNALGSNGSSPWGNGTGVSNANRQTFVGLKKNGLGQASLGTQYTPLHTNVGMTSANGQNNIMGDMIYTAGTTQNYTVTTGAVNAPLAQPSSALASSSSSGYTVRAGNMLLLQSERMAGISAQAMVVANGMNNTQGSTTAGTNETSGPNNRNGYGAALNYTAGKLVAAANYQTFKAINPYGTAGDVTTNGATYGTIATQASDAGKAGAFTSTAQSGLNIQDTQYYVGAGYDFGILKAYAQYINRKYVSQVNPSWTGSRSAQQIGVRGNITPTIDAWASVGNGSYTALASSSTAVPGKQNIVGYQLGSNYYLSKRTNLYAIYGGYGASVSSSSTGSTANAAYNGNNYAVGLRHTF
jgi:predicted porin